MFSERGAVVVAVSDVSEAVMNTSLDGLDVEALRSHISQGKGLGSFPNGEQIPNKEILQVPCDILVPAAIGGVITEANAKSLSCKYIIEAANGPITPEADRLLLDQGMTVLPDIYANGGGVTVSFFEWVQNLQNFRWEEFDVNAKLARKMEIAFSEFWKVSKEKQVPLRTAAFIVAIERVTRAAIHRGFD